MNGNYKPISIYPTFSKNFEKCMSAQISTFLITFFFSQQCVLKRIYYSILSSSNVKNVEEVFR